jgi:hypothetical protein
MRPRRRAKRLVSRDFEGKKVQDLLGQRDLTLNEATVIIGRKIGRPDLKYVQFSYADTLKALTEMGIGTDASNRFVEMSKALNDGLFAVNRPRTSDNTTPTSIEEFAETFALIYAASAPRKAA